MGRHRPAEERMSLFPFLSIVICVIGCLTIMLASEALSKIDQKPNTEEVERTAKYRQLQSQLKDSEEELDGRRDSEYAAAFAETIKRAESDLNSLQEEKRSRDQKVSEAEAQTADARAEIDRLKKHIDQTQKEIKQREVLKEELADQAEAKKKPAPPAVAVRPTGTGKNIRPFFVECRDNSIVLHNQKESVPIPITAAASNAEYLATLDKASKTENGIVIFMLRENGIGTYSMASNIAADHGCRNGKIPLIGQGRVDVSSFRRLMEKNDS